MFSVLSGLLPAAWAKARESVLPKPPQENEPETEEARKTRIQGLLGLYGLSTIAYISTSWISRQISNKRMDLYFVVMLLYTVAVTVLVFALEYYGLSKLVPGSFSDAHPSFFQLLTLSFCTLMTSEMAPVRPVSDIALTLSIANLFCSFLILGLLATIIITSSRERYATDLNKLVGELDNVHKEVASFIQQSYALTITKLSQ